MRPSSSPKPAPSYRLSWRDRAPGWLSPLLGLPLLKIGLTLVAAAFLAQQIDNPNSRIIKLLAGIVIMVLAFRIRPFYALCFIAVMFLFPFSIFVGSSTMIFIVLACGAYLARLTLHREHPPGRTPADIGVGLLFAAYILSFYNVETPIALQRGVVNFIGITASLLLFFMTAIFIRTEQQLRMFVRVLTFTISAAIAVGIFELLFPGQVLIPHWILHKATGIGSSDHRVSGPLYDYELFGEFMAISFFLVFFQYHRTNTPNQRFFLGLLSLMCIFMLLTTVTRGATIAFAGGLVYLLWIIRSRVKFRDLVALALTVIGIYLVMDLVIVNLTRSGSVFDRILGTEFVGYVPEARGHWPEVLDRALEHPFIGHGPYYDLGQGRGFTGQGLYTYLWPHNQYLFYLHTVGFFGLGAFLFVGGRLLYLSSKLKAASLQESSYPRSLMVALHVMLLVFLVDQIKIEYIRNSIYEFFPWMLMGLVAATAKIIKRQEAEGRAGKGAG